MLHPPSSHVARLRPDVVVISWIRRRRLVDVRPPCLLYLAWQLVGSRTYTHVFPPPPSPLPYALIVYLFIRIQSGVDSGLFVVSRTLTCPRYIPPSVALSLSRCVPSRGELKNCHQHRVAGIPVVIFLAVVFLRCEL